MGWYRVGGRLCSTSVAPQWHSGTTCPIDASTGMVQCNWTQAYTLATQTTWTSGCVYSRGADNSQKFNNYVVFVVRDERECRVA